MVNSRIKHRILENVELTKSLMIKLKIIINLPRKDLCTGWFIKLQKDRKTLNNRHKLHFLIYDEDADKMLVQLK